MPPKKQASSSQQMQIYVPNQQNRRRRRRNRRRRVGRPRFRRSFAPTSFSFSTATYANQRTTRNGAIHVISREIFQIVKGDGDILNWALPYTPSKWSNTRTAQIVRQYASFRPIAVRLIWQPMVSTDTSGSFTMGTIFNSIKVNYGDVGGAERSLAGTNGGFITTIWKPCVSKVRLSTCLRANNFPTNCIDPDDIPFWITSSINSNVDGHVGHVIIESVISLTNPINTEVTPLPSTIFSAHIIHDNEEDKTQMSIASTSLGTIAENDQCWFVPLNNVVNTAGEIIANMFEPITATLASIISGTFNFDLPSAIASQTVDIIFGGRPSNFRL